MGLSVANNPKHYPKPEEFKPERWLEQNPERDPFSFIPYNCGPRNCIGLHMAIIEIKIALAYIVNNFQVKLNQNVELKMRFKSLYEPNDDKLVVFYKRR